MKQITYDYDSWSRLSVANIIPLILGCITGDSITQYHFEVTPGNYDARTLGKQRTEQFVEEYWDTEDSEWLTNGLYFLKRNDVRMVRLFSKPDQNHLRKHDSLPSDKANELWDNAKNLKLKRRWICDRTMIEEDGVWLDTIGPESEGVTPRTIGTVCLSMCHSERVEFLFKYQSPCPPALFQLVGAPHRIECSNPGPPTQGDPNSIDVLTPSVVWQNFRQTMPTHRSRSVMHNTLLTTAFGLCNPEKSESDIFVDIVPLRSCLVILYTRFASSKTLKDVQDSLDQLHHLFPELAPKLEIQYFAMTDTLAEFLEGEDDRYIMLEVSYVT